MVIFQTAGAPYLRGFALLLGTFTHLLKQRAHTSHQPVEKDAEGESSSEDDAPKKTNTKKQTKKSYTSSESSDDEKKQSSKKVSSGDESSAVEEDTSEQQEQKTYIKKETKISKVGKYLNIPVEKIQMAKKLWKAIKLLPPDILLARYNENLFLVVADEGNDLREDEAVFVYKVMDFNGNIYQIVKSKMVIVGGEDSNKIYDIELAKSPLKIIYGLKGRKITNVGINSEKKKEKKEEVKSTKSKSSKKGSSDDSLSDKGSSDDEIKPIELESSGESDDDNQPSAKLSIKDDSGSESDDD